MGVFEMVVAIVAISVVGKIALKELKAKHELELKKETIGSSDSAERIAQMEDRLIVLERIVTSEGYDLKQQFKDIENK